MWGDKHISGLEPQVFLNPQSWGSLVFNYQATYTVQLVWFSITLAFLITAFKGPYYNLLVAKEGLTSPAHQSIQSLRRPSKSSM